MHPSTTPATSRQHPGPISAHGALWPDTLPMAEDMTLALPDTGPFRETLTGLHVRELLNDALFQRFFGPRR
jgi:hypothetical protein